jgi:hypothetical protein
LPGAYRITLPANEQTLGVSVLSRRRCRSRTSCSTTVRELDLALSCSRRVSNSLVIFMPFQREQRRRLLSTALNWTNLRYRRHQRRWNIHRVWCSGSDLLHVRSLRIDISGRSDCWLDANRDECGSHCGTRRLFLTAGLRRATSASISSFVQRIEPSQFEGGRVRHTMAGVKL